VFGNVGTNIGLRFQVLSKVSMKCIACCYIASCCLLEVHRRFRGAYCLHNLRPDDGGITRLWNVGLLQRDYSALYLILCQKAVIFGCRPTVHVKERYRIQLFHIKHNITHCDKTHWKSPLYSILMSTAWKKITCKYEKIFFKATFSFLSPFPPARYQMTAVRIARDFCWTN
jgi:hypothetical protein